MHVEITKQPKSVVSLRGSLTSQEFDDYIKQVTTSFVAEAELPGFRKGKAPEHMVVEKVGETALLEEAAHAAFKKMIPAILTEHHIQALAYPQIRITKLARGNPLEFEITITEDPDITLPDYHTIAREKNALPSETIPVTAEEVDEVIEQLRKSRKSALVSGSTGEEILPELTDEFARSLGSFQTVDDLKHAIEENKKMEKQERERNKRRMEALQAIAQKMSVDLPEVLVEAEKEKMLSELRYTVENVGIPWEEYLGHIKKQEEDIRKEWVGDAERRVLHSLILREIAKKESIEPTEDELNTWMYQSLASFSEEEKKKVDRERLQRYAYGVIREQKTLEFLEHIH